MALFLAVQPWSVLAAILLVTAQDGMKKEIAYAGGRTGCLSAQLLRGRRRRQRDDLQRSVPGLAALRCARLGAARLDGRRFTAVAAGVGSSERARDLRTVAGLDHGA